MSSAPSPAPPAPAAAAAPAPPKKGNPYWKVASPFLLGGLSGMAATCVIQPIDMVKVRIQLLGEGGTAIQSKNPISIAMKIIRDDGFGGLYKGLSAGLLRQATYTTVRLGIWRKTTEVLQGEDKKKPLPLSKKALSATTAGAIGAMFGTPADVALIRMQADTMLEPSQRRNYTGVVNALSRILKEEGVVKGLFAGNGPVIVRAAFLNLGMLTSYEQAKESLRPYVGSQVAADNYAKLISGFCASAFSLPFDFVKTRIQKQKKLPDGSYPYKSFAHCFSRVLTEEGPMAFYRGFWTYYVRIAPHAMITLAVLEQLNKLTKDW